MLSRYIVGTPIINICTTYMLKKKLFLHFGILRRSEAQSSCAHMTGHREPCVFKVHANGGDKLTSGFKFEHLNEPRVLGLCPSNYVVTIETIFTIGR